MTPDDDPQLLVVDVVSSRRRYGRPRGSLSRGAWVPRRRAPDARRVRTPCGGRASTPATALDEVREQRQHLVELLELSRSLAAAREVPQVADQVSVAVTTVVGGRSRRGLLGRLGRHHVHVASNARMGRWRATRSALPSPRHRQPRARRSVATRQSRGASASTAPSGMADVCSAVGLHSALLAPIITSDRIIGRAPRGLDRCRTETVRMIPGSSGRTGRRRRPGRDRPRAAPSSSSRCATKRCTTPHRPPQCVARARPR